MSLMTHIAKRPQCKFLLPNSWLWRFIRAKKSTSTDVDVLDSFVDEIVLKFDVKHKAHTENILFSNQFPPNSPSFNFKRSVEIFSKVINLKESDGAVDIRSLTEDQKNDLLIKSLEENNVNDIYYLVDELLANENLPWENTIFKLLHFLSGKTDGKHFHQIIDLCCKMNPTLFNKNLQFRHYVAYNLWLRGNSNLSLNLFKEMYAECDKEMGKNVKELMKEVVKETIGKSEAVLISVVDVGEYYGAEFDDFEILIFLWECCFQSQWFSDQQTANSLFYKTYQLRKSVSLRAGYLCFKLLRDHNLEAVHRMIELFLKFHMKHECRLVLIRLFDYQIWRKDTRACSEILENARALDITMPHFCNAKLANLVSGQQPFVQKIKGPKNETFELKF